VSKETTRRKCRTCGQRRLFEREKQNNVLHLLLTLITFGAVKPYRCTVCGESRL
jgi:hypothetical protein